MSQKYIIKAVDRSAKGLTHVQTPGRFWPSNQEVIVELLDQDECPMIKADKSGYPDLPSMSQVGRKAWALIEADGRLSKKPFGVAADQSEIETLKAKIAKLEGLLSDSEEDRLKLNEKIDEYVKVNALITQESEDAKKKADELTALLESATKAGEVDPHPTLVVEGVNKPAKSKAVK
jgi:hypothetical protein